MLAAAYAVVDVETTGLDPDHDRVVEVAVVRLTSFGVTTAEYVTLVRPDPSAADQPCADDVAAEIHGITADQLGDAPTFRHVAASLAARLAGAVVVGHNVAFDLGFLTAEFRRLGVEVPQLPALCTRSLAVRLHPELERRRLADCCAAAGVTLDGAHTALGDARATARLLTAYLGTARARGATTLADLGCTPLVRPPVVWWTGLPLWSVTRPRERPAMA